MGGEAVNVEEEYLLNEEGRQIPFCFWKGLVISLRIAEVVALEC